MNYKYLSLVAVTIFLLLVVGCGKDKKVPDESAIVIKRFDLSDVSLLAGPFRDAQERNGVYLLSLDPDRLLHMFRVTSGLESQSSAYGGWEQENSEVRGHSMGHYLSALA
ncbi:MAG: glycoside hydrolase family 127 protein, partial [Bacteroidales bacterium]